MAKDPVAADKSKKFDTDDQSERPRLDPGRMSDLFKGVDNINRRLDALEARVTQIEGKI